jgi:NADH-quinone oxidoreductase subunit L
MTALLWLLVLLPALAGGLLLTTRAERVAAAVGIGVATVTLTLAAAVAAARPQASAPFLAGHPFALRVDGLAALVLVVVAVVALAVLVASLAEVERSRARFHGLMLLFLSGVLGTATAASLLPLLMAWELMGAASYALIALHWRDGDTVRSGNTAFLTTRAADLGLYAAAGAALVGSGSLALDRLPELTGWPLHLATAGLVVAALGKAAQLPFSFWLARAMQGPSTVSALLHSAAMVAMGGYLLLRVAPLLGQTSWGQPVVAWAGVLTAVLLGLVALGQSDLKLLLAASTASQLGFVVLAAGLGGVTAGTLHLVGHAFVKSTLFLAAGAWLDALGTKELGELRGVARRHPVLGALFVTSALSLAGLPPLTLWATKDEVLAAALARSPELYAAGLLAAAVAAGYAGRAVALVLRPQQRPKDAPVPLGAQLPLVPLAVLAVLGGAVALPPVRSAVERLLAAPPGPAPRLWELLLSSAVAVVAFAAAWRSAEHVPQVVPCPVRHWLRLEDAAHLLVVRPVLALARALAVLDDRVLDRSVVAGATAVPRLAGRLRSFDDHGLDRLVSSTSPLTVRVADLSRRTDEAGVDAGVASLAHAVRRLGDAARRPQTGQLHQYLAQAATVLVLAVVLLLLR